MDWFKLINLVLDTVPSVIVAVDKLKKENPGLTDAQAIEMLKVEALRVATQAGIWLAAHPKPVQ